MAGFSGKQILFLFLVLMVMSYLAKRLVPGLPIPAAAKNVVTAS